MSHRKRAVLKGEPAIFAKAPHIKWPESVPVLEAGDIHKGWFDGLNGSHCLVGWVDAVLGDDSRAKTQVWHLVYRRVRGDVVYWNDVLASKQEVADVWNAVMTDLGYTEIE